MDKLDRFDQLLGEIEKLRDVRDKVKPYDLTFGVSFTDYFQLYVSHTLNYGSEITYDVYGIYENYYRKAEDLPNEIKMTQNKTVIEVIRTNTDETYQMAIYLQDLTAYQRLLTEDFMANMIEPLDVYYKIKFLNEMNPEKSFLLLMYQLTAGDLEESLYVAISRV